MSERIAILGSTGSIGVNTLEVARRLRKRFKVIALSADSNITLLSAQARIFRPEVIAVRNEALAHGIKKLVPSRTKIVCGTQGLNELVSRRDIDMVVCAISGSSCLLPLVNAIKCAKRIALANKEALVSAGSIIMKLAKRHKAAIIPIDSEHSAIFQCLEGKRRFLKKIYLTGSGGPLLAIPKNRFDAYPREFILKHPKWRMGKKISVDSATMMNKGLEVIEARWLFDVDETNIEVLIHPEAIVHSMVELIDGTVFAELSTPDMRIPIQYALTYPDRSPSAAIRLNFTSIEKLSFQKPDLKKFPCLSLARTALKKGGTHPAVLNAADEEAVKGYLDGRIPFSRIPMVIEKVLERHKDIKKEPSIGDICTSEEWARQEARILCYR